jgi:hypothetical protein
LTIILNNWLKNSLIITVIILNSFSYGQTITGTIRDTKNNALSGATIIAHKTNSSSVLSYAISDINGRYNLAIHTMDSLQVSASFIGFSKATKIINSKNQELNFVLQESSEALKEVILRARAIVQKGDTLNYSIASFKGKEDRVIADVLAKMPGIDVLADGKILYQGKPIQKYYIEGLDLLEGRYNLANNNLPADAVSRVQILENHQPIKVLDSLVYNDKTSLNIKLKKGIVWSGTATLGVGVNPLLWDNNISPMLFTKKQQFISSYQSNNTGNDVSREVNVLTIADLLNGISFQKTIKYLHIKNTNPPPFSKERWLDNNVHLFSLNYLQKIKKDYELKTNISFVNDSQEEYQERSNTIYTPTSTIYLNENISNKHYINKLKTNFIFLKNQKNGYLKNDLSVNGTWNSDKGNVINQNDIIEQNNENSTFAISNKLKWIKPIGKKLITIRSISSHSKTPEYLWVNSSIFSNLLNNGNVYNSVLQNTISTQFNIDNSISFTKEINKFTISQKIGFTINSSNLISTIQIEDTGNHVLGGGFVNDFSFQKNSIYTNLKTIYKHKKWRIVLKTPLEYLLIRKTNQANFNALNFKPRINFRNEFSAFWKFNFGAGFSNNYGTINNQFPAYILTNYQSIKHYNSILSKANNFSYQFGFQYKNPLKSIFISSYYSNTKTKNNTLLKQEIDSNGASSYSFLQENNFSKNQQLNIRLSKYMSKYKMLIAFTSFLSKSKKEQLINNNIENINTNILKLEAKANIDLSDKIVFNIKSIYNLSRLKYASLANNQVQNISHNLSFDYFFKDRHYLGLNGEYYQNKGVLNDQENYFLNLKYHYTFKKRKIDFVLKWKNLLNTKSFTESYTTDFSVIESSYLMRPSQLIGSLKFNF